MLGRIRANTPLGRALGEIGFDLAIWKSTYDFGHRCRIGIMLSVQLLPDFNYPVVSPF